MKELKDLSLADLIALKNEVEIFSHKYQMLTGVNSSDLISAIKIEVKNRISQIKF